RSAPRRHLPRYRAVCTPTGLRHPRGPRRPGRSARLAGCVATNVPRSALPSIPTGIPLVPATTHADARLSLRRAGRSHSLGPEPLRVPTTHAFIRAGGGSDEVATSVPVGPQSVRLVYRSSCVSRNAILIAIDPGFQLAASVLRTS